MGISMGTIVAVVYVVLYFAFGLKGAERFVDNNLSRLYEKRRWLRYVLIAIAALVFAYIEFVCLILKAFVKFIQIITRV